jgi:site-specific recombinase XerD
LDDETREQVISLIKNYKHRLIARIQNVTGVRAGDIFRLKRGSITYEAYDDDTVVLRIDFLGKGGKRFVKWIFDTSIQAHIDVFLKSNYLNTEYYFIENETVRDKNKSDEVKVFMTNYHMYWKDLKQALTTAGVEYKEFASHDFRRTLARNVWNETKDPVVLKEMLNHQDFNTTLRYLRGTGLQVRDVYHTLHKNKSHR